MWSESASISTVLVHQLYNCVGRICLYFALISHLSLFVTEPVRNGIGTFGQGDLGGSYSIWPYVSSTYHGNLTLYRVLVLVFIYIYMYFEDGRSTSRNALDKDLIEIIHEYKDIGESASKRWIITGMKALMSMLRKAAAVGVICKELKSHLFKAIRCEYSSLFKNVVRANLKSFLEVNCQAANIHYLTKAHALCHFEVIMMYFQSHYPFRLLGFWDQFHLNKNKRHMHPLQLEEDLLGHAHINDLD